MNLYNKIQEFLSTYETLQTTQQKAVNNAQDNLKDFLKQELDKQCQALKKEITLYQQNQLQDEFKQIPLKISTIETELLQKTEEKIQSQIEQELNTTKIKQTELKAELYLQALLEINKIKTLQNVFMQCQCEELNALKLQNLINYEKEQAKLLKENPIQHIYLNH
ncbi:hypothetical protein [Helicobacter cetorum]|uniref:Uncharacterized protein n=1 Tax=Helicobacter cetorum (strain ATCC BAA-540 / CCUG 52418 / MIT 99-5656) TaxID=1163745 RepID=I0EQJ2_HELCM|nr:hypothetical protein [Helicobacter cetorum]AFI05211.1 hypothetical protein HCD_00895 [Helicobacter cetorum MIT 99-5656]AFI06015.1 hypothetical protein HCD_05065 [Helicobacter cetorum MIT 99-5656]